MVGRRYEVKFGSWPYRLFALCSDRYTVEEKRAIAQEALQTKRCCRDMFTEGVCLRFPTVDRMLSDHAAATLRATFSNLVLATDLSERMNAEIAASKPSRGHARDFVHFSRESLLKQARTVHMQRGGSDPLKPSGLQASAEPCSASVLPLLDIQARSWPRPRGGVCNSASYSILHLTVGSNRSFEDSVRPLFGLCGSPLGARP